MKKVAVIMLVLLGMGVFVGTASAKARGIIVWGPTIGYGHGVPHWGIPVPAQK